MSYWQFDRRDVAEPHNVKVRLNPVLGGYELYLDVFLRTIEWPHWSDGRPLTVIPEGANLSLEVQGRQASLGSM